MLKNLTKLEVASKGFIPPLMCKRRVMACFRLTLIIHGTCYKVDKNTILLAEMRNSNPVFGAVANIWLHERLAFFALKLFATVNFSAVLGAYEREQEQLPSGLFVVEASDLLMTTVTHIYKYEGAMFICPREDPNALLE